MVDKGSRINKWYAPILEPNLDFLFTQTQHGQITGDLKETPGTDGVRN